MPLAVQQRYLSYQQTSAQNVFMGSDLSESLAPWIAERAEARTAEWQRRKDARAKVRAERKAARDAGLVARHARKLGRQATA